MIPKLKFVSVGHFTSSGVWKHPTVTLPSWELIYMTEGEARVFVGNREIVAREGDAFLFPAGVEHGGSAESRERVSFLWMHVMAQDSEAEEFLRSLEVKPCSVKTTQIPMTARQLLHRASLGIYPSEMNDMTAELIFAEYALWLGERSEQSAGGELINRIKEWIRINADRKITVADLAREFSYNEDYITRIFAKKAGLSLKNYIDHQRMDLLRTKLLTTDSPLKLIAAESGFEDYKAFLKFFTYHEGMTPTEFRESCYMTHRNNK